MEKINVIYKPEIENYINELVYVLYQEQYFDNLENAIRYKDKIIDFIEGSIANFPYKQTPLPLHSLSSKYIFYNSNRKTTWYIFFEKENGTYPDYVHYQQSFRNSSILESIRFNSPYTNLLNF
ncbi:MAG: hypothetical protein KF845_04625 [Cyclobacteriaceae bacterium]|nr:hypothetical protein [Cyclobacteriaceae bacterium]